MLIQLTDRDISTAKSIKLGYHEFKLMESSSGITYYNEREDRGIFLGGKFDSAAVKKEIKDFFDEQYEREGAVGVGIRDIAEYIHSKKREVTYGFSNRRMVRSKNVFSKISVIGGAYLNVPGNDERYNVADAKRTGFVQGVCECAAAISEDAVFSKKLLDMMGVTKNIAEKYAYPDTYKELEKTVFALKKPDIIDFKMDETDFAFKPKLSRHR